MLLHADRILNPELFHWRNISTADLGIFSLGRKISASQSLPRNIFASENIPAGKSILAEYSGCYTGKNWAMYDILMAVEGSEANEIPVHKVCPSEQER